MIRVGVIGAGLIGRERISAVRALADKGRPVTVQGLYDKDLARAKAVAAEFNTSVFDSIDALLAANPDWIIVAVAHDVAVPLTLRALAQGCSVLMEKPMGRDLEEARQLLDAGGDRLMVGFNYRFFSGVRQALRDVREGVFGKLVGIDFVLGHGCQPGLEKTWKLNLEHSGGGCLIDPGVHLLDLCLLLAPEKIEVAGGCVWDGFWKTGIEEDVRLLLSSGCVTISLHISIVQWRSTFELQIQGTERYGIVSGRNRSYGPQTYRTGPRWGWQIASNQIASETLVVEADGQDSFILEMDAVLFPSDAKQDCWPTPCTANEAFAVMRLLDDIRGRLGLPQSFSSK